MTQALTIDGRVLAPISQTMYELVRHSLPRRPLQPGVVWVADTCWVASYNDARMLPEHFTGWECLNEVKDRMA